MYVLIKAFETYEVHVIIFQYIIKTTETKI